MLHIHWKEKLGRKKGRFFCPVCVEHREYREIRDNEYVGAGFLSFKTSSILKGILCLTCKSRMDHGYLSYSPDDIRRSASPWECQNCGTRNEFTSAGCRSCASLRPDLAEASQRSKPEPRIND